jgi:outer membrane immunogenic protein
MSRYFGWALAAAMATGHIGSALAADLPLKAKAPPPVVAPVYNWSGFYVGGELGGLWARADGSFVNPPPATYSNKGSTGAGGGFIGVQYQWDKVVLGAEANVVALFSRNLGASSCTPLAACSAGTTIGNSLSSAVWSVGPRFGIAAGNWMPYATGGYAATRLSNTLFTAAGTILEGYRNDRSGWYAGAGVDWAYTRNWIFGVEYRHYDFGTSRGIPALATTGALVPFDTTDVALRADSIVARASYKFDWAQPVVAKY